MASSKDYLDFILEQLSDLEEISYRSMMGEYIIYYRGKIIGGIYDDRFLVKSVRSAIALMPNAKYELPYDGAKEMLLVDDVEGIYKLVKTLNFEIYRELTRNQYQVNGAEETQIEFLIQDPNGYLLRFTNW